MSITIKSVKIWWNLWAFHGKACACIGKESKVAGRILCRANVKMLTCALPIPPKKKKKKKVCPQGAAETLSISGSTWDLQKRFIVGDAAEMVANWWLVPCLTREVANWTPKMESSLELKDLPTLLIFFLAISKLIKLR